MIKKYPTAKEVKELWNNDRDNSIHYLYCSMISVAEISKKFNLSRHRIYQIINKKENDRFSDSKFDPELLPILNIFKEISKYLYENKFSL